MIMASTEKSSHLNTLLHLARSLAILEQSPWDKVVLHSVYITLWYGGHLPYGSKLGDASVADLINVIRKQIEPACHLS